jgi:histone H3/H4
MAEELPTTPFKRVIRKMGGNRVSQGAAEELADVVESFAEEVAEEAVLLSEHADRETVFETDVENAPLTDKLNMS